MAKNAKQIWMLTVSIILLIVPLGIADQYQPVRHPNGWYWPTISGSTNTEPGTGYNGWLEPYDVLMNGVRVPAIHAGKDFEGSQGEPVFAVANGEVIKQEAYLTGYGPNGDAGGALIAQFKTSDGRVFRALYGHIDNPHKVGPVHAGEILGYINSYDPSHLHFGIHLGDMDPSDGKDYRGFTRKDEYTGDTYGWVDPIEFLATNEPPESVVGEWSLHYKWDIFDNPEDCIITFYSDGTFQDSEPIDHIHTGKWLQNGDAVRWQYDGSDGAIYSGTIKMSNMDGVMSTDIWGQGEWSADRRYTDSGAMA